MKKPFLRALSAALYIALVVLAIHSMDSLFIEDNIFMPMLALSIVVLSVALMAFLFFSDPVLLYIEGKKNEALVFFGKTVAFFACFVSLFFFIMVAVTVL